MSTMLNSLKNAMYPSIRCPRQKDLKDIKRVLFVDPGIGGTGIAFFKRIRIRSQSKVVFSPDFHAVIQTKIKSDWAAKCHDIGFQFFNLLQKIKPSPRYVMFEFPEIWTSSAKGMASAGSGDVLKLVYLIGRMSAAASDALVHTIVLASPREWKGQLTKEAVDIRIKRALPDLDQKWFVNHLSDAVGMGLSAQGVFDET